MIKSLDSEGNKILISQAQADYRTVCAKRVGYVLRLCTLNQSKPEAERYLCWEKETNDGKKYGDSNSSYHMVYNSKYIEEILWPDDVIAIVEDVENGIRAMLKASGASQSEIQQRLDDALMAVSKQFESELFGKTEELFGKTEQQGEK